MYPVSHTHRSYLISLYIAVLLLGMTGLFGKFLSLSPFTIIAGRSFYGIVFEPEFVDP